MSRSALRTSSILINVIQYYYYYYYFILVIVLCFSAKSTILFPVGNPTDSLAFIINSLALLPAHTDPVLSPTSSNSSSVIAPSGKGSSCIVLHIISSSSSSICTKPLASFLISTSNPCISDSAI